MKQNYYLEDALRYNNKIFLNTDILVRKPIEIGKNNIVIDGNGHVIDGNGKKRLFKIKGKNIILKNLIFKNAKAPTSRIKRGGYGGAIFNEGQLKLINCEFIDNVAKNDGYDILNTGELNIENCRFSQEKTGKNAIYNVGLIQAFDDEKNELKHFISDSNIEWIQQGPITAIEHKPNSEILIDAQSSVDEVACELATAFKQVDDGDDGYILHQPFDAYEGDEPFVFISYKHVDYKKVYPIIDKFHKAGINIWYDAGLPVGKNYDIQIAKHIMKSSLFVTFVTEEAIRCSSNDEDYLIKEAYVAIHLDKKCLPIYLDKVDLDGFYLMHYLGKQSILKFDYKNNEEKFIEACLSAFKDFGIKPNK